VTVVLLDPRWPGVVPVAALALLRGPVQVTADVAVEGLGLEVVATGGVLVSSDAAHPEVLRRTAAGEDVVAASPPPGVALLDAVAVMDRLRSPGGCPWDAEQTHESLRRYLVEECYELLDALASGVREDVVEELGDVLLQVLFHARVAEDFTVDDVATGLVAKLVHRHPHVFAGSEVVAGAAAQELRWDELKAVEKKRASAVDGVALAQPALALAAKLVSRAGRAGLPDELVPGPLRGLDGDAEDTLREAALAFAADVRVAEQSARGAGLDPSRLTGVEWSTHWPG
jgi:XTP/dITP diphosphohydrolase